MLPGGPSSVKSICACCQVCPSTVLRGCSRLCPAASFPAAGGPTRVERERDVRLVPASSEDPCCSICRGHPGSPARALGLSRCILRSDVLGPYLGCCMMLLW